VNYLRILSLLLPSLLLLSSQASAQGSKQPTSHRVLAADASKRRIAIFDANGKIEWEHPIRSIHDLQLLDNGNILFQTTWTRLVEVTRKNQVVWSYDSGERNGNTGKRVEVHAFQRLEDGSTMIAESGPGRIIEVDKQGSLLRQIKLQVSKPHPHRDTRLVRKLQNGNYLVAHEGDGAVKEYDPSGKVVWDYAVPLFDRKRHGGHGPEAWGNQVFCAIRLPNGNTLISTGNGHSVLEVTPEKQIVWHLRQNELPGIQLAWVTTLEVLPNGNYLIGNCHAGPNNPQIIEVTQHKKVVWKFKDFHNLGNALSNSTLVDTFEDERFFRTKVEPILAKNCYRCHGNRDKKIRGQLWLKARANVVEGSSSGAIVDLHSPETSRILRFINHETSEHQMPPKKKLAQADIDILTEWVHRGVPMTVVENEWVYKRPSMFTEKAKKHWSYQPIDDPRPPTTQRKNWTRSDLDTFVLAGLEAANLSPNPAADRISFLRRASYNVTGLPPTPEETQAFLADKSPKAYETLVDRLLASKHYGEHWGRHWLDLVRYGETNGYERDSKKPEVWKYRQYVIDAFNSNKRYDRFLREQIAGDELPDADTESITATGFMRLGLWDDEPSDRKQARYDGLDDIVRTTSEVFLGMTLGCARCHDHKLDPIPQTNYYSFLAFFHNTRPFSRNKQHVLTDVSSAAAREEAEKANQVRRQRRAEVNAEMVALRKEFLAALTKNRGKSSESDMTDVEFAFFRDTWQKLPDFDAIKAETVGKIPSNRFDIGLATRESDFGFVFKGRLFVPRNGKYTFILDSDDGARLHLDGKAVLDYDGVHGLGTQKRVKLELSKGEHSIKLEYFQGQGGQGLFLAWSGPGFKQRMLSAGQQDNNVGNLEQRLIREGRQFIGAAKVKQYQLAKREFNSLGDRDAGMYVLSITENGPKAPPTHLMIRGSAHALAEEVQPGFPQILTSAKPQITAQKKTTGRRLALTDWMVSKDNQVTARVMVNRIWQYHFGRGLVRGSSEFGMQGRKPTHPKLLDWLARRFLDSDWDMKQLHRQILLSATFRMSSADNAVASAKDPTNDLLWRFEMRRLSAEEIRDTVMTVSNQLDLQTFGGPSVFPTIPQSVLKGQSANKWNINTAVEHNSRRSVYTFVMRSLIDPFIEGFDGATTDTSCPERFQTTQPTQALTLINSGFMHRAAEALAKRIQGKASGNRKQQIKLAWKLATGREANSQQINTALQFMETYPKPSNELKILHQYCLIVLNLNEFLFVD
jgi:hypothetical protein